MRLPRDAHPNPFLPHVPDRALFLATLSVQFFLNLAFYLQEFLEYLLVNRVGWWNSFRLLLYIQPSFLVLTLPVAFLFALLLVMGRLSADRELTALESCGISGWMLAAPLLAVGLAFSGFMVYFMDRTLPWGNTSFIQLQYHIVSEQSALAVKERVFIRDFPGYELYVGRKDAGDKLHNVEVALLDSTGSPERLILAEEGAIRRDPKTYNVLLELRTGILQQVGWDKVKDLPKEKFLNMNFETCSIDLDLRRARSGLVDTSGANNISAKKLYERIKVRESRGERPVDDEIGLQKKFSIPFSALAFALIGVPIGYRNRMGSVGGVVLAILLILCYYLLLMGGEMLAQDGRLSPAWAMWSPNILLGSIGLGLLLWVVRSPVRSSARVSGRKG